MRKQPITWMLVTAGLVLGATPATSKDNVACQTNAFTYTNTSPNYSVGRLTMAYFDANGEKQEVRLWDQSGIDVPAGHSDFLEKGDSKTIVIKNAIGLKDVPDGSEIWLKVGIYGGEKKSCRKDKHRLYYNPDAGGEMKFRTSGNLTTNNACKFDGKAEKMCVTE